MNYASIKTCDIANGPGVRVSLFVSGCTHHCEGCFNAVAWDFDYGEPFTEQVEQGLLDALRPAYIRGLTLLGGEPMEPVNQVALLPFLRRIRRELPEKSIWCYSGYTWEELTGQTPSRCRQDTTDELLSLLDVLVDGPYVASKRDLMLRFRGSSNQRILDVPRSLASGAPQLWQDVPAYAQHGR